jgi:hypothetical protein
MAGKKGINPFALAVMIICSAMLTAGLVLLFFSGFIIYKSYNIMMSIEVANSSAFNTDTGSIDFGKAAPGNSNTRSIILVHDFAKPLLVHFRAKGNISQFVPVPDDFYLEPGLSKEVSISAIIPGDARHGSYEGKLTVYFRRM